MEQKKEKKGSSIGVKEMTAKRREGKEERKKRKEARKRGEKVKMTVTVLPRWP